MFCRKSNHSFSACLNGSVCSYLKSFCRLQLIDSERCTCQARAYLAGLSGQWEVLPSNFQPAGRGPLHFLLAPSRSQIAEIYCCRLVKALLGTFRRSSAYSTKARQLCCLQAFITNSYQTFPFSIRPKFESII